MDRIRRLPTGMVWGLGVLPLALLVWDTLAGNLGVDPVRDIEHRLGRTAVYFLIASLCVTPILRIARVNLVKFRRPLGLLAASYAGLHLLAWAILDMGLLWPQMLRDIAKRPYLTIGMAVLVILLVMAATSSNGAIRWLGPMRWRVIHRWVYLAAPLAVFHWLLAYKIWPAKPLVILALVAILLALRLPWLQGRLKALPQSPLKSSE
ncbi:sulfite oxidase heme-binding subunit YedZ [Paracoccus sp. MC1862]|uniref:sulfite oxidase heme-binding subunit YedZ n=1 Tax=Paracoccus sp. MC1862 TaxID=2760307 RepID=UPI001602ADC0|nr:protein-methionine-sulfoxide reductase heme-binding subunit MsrQ [Paracoccus sp. MC1862]MBB1497851.1 sulfoxide reductase heme-binding subunit YedZ [Paracoccus sp. MC1862]QQO44251.1 sulfoxide reductase heme-binding subunit YedZ [Paracoccus sp. MC1862]